VPVDGAGFNIEKPIGATAPEDVGEAGWAPSSLLPVLSMSRVLVPTDGEILGSTVVAEVELPKANGAAVVPFAVPRVLANTVA
jgi:hypothetical protein